MLAPFSVLVAASLCWVQASAPANRLVARVDPRVELLSLVFRLAGNSEYNQPSSNSRYAEEVAEYFEPYKDHAVVRLARKLRQEHGVSYDAVMAMAVHLEARSPDVAETAGRSQLLVRPKMPFAPRPERLDQRWTAADARRFVERVQQFVDEAEFSRFLAEHEKYYAAAAERLTAQLAERDFVGWFDGFFGARRGAKFEVYVGLLNGGGCYGVGVVYPDGREEICPVIGAGEFDAEGLPVFREGVEGTVVHELCHTYTNPFVDRFADELRPAAERIFKHCEAAMRDQAYGTAKTLMYESLVRASTVRYLHARRGAAAAKKAVAGEHERGFEWVGELSELLGEYEKDRERYPSFDAFMPRVVKFFEEYAGEYEERAARAPHVVSMVPANGADDVDAALTEIRITFDRPMRDKSWSVVGGGPHFPETAGEISYDDERKVLTIPVRLKPNWSYEFWLNRRQFKAFRSAEGVPLEPVPVKFRTRAE
ncbi:MAG: DUF4932 domain-containing protein [Planctomycetota bacterium]